MLISVFKMMLKIWNEIYIFTCCVSFFGEHSILVNAGIQYFKNPQTLTQRPLLMSEVNLIQQMKSDCNRRKTIKHLHYEIFNEFHCTYW
jgi:hypothetical protein